MWTDNKGTHIMPFHSNYNNYNNNNNANNNNDANRYIGVNPNAHSDSSLAGDLSNGGDTTILGPSPCTSPLNAAAAPVIAGGTGAGMGAGAGTHAAHGHGDSPPQLQTRVVHRPTSSPIASSSPGHPADAHGHQSPRVAAGAATKAPGTVIVTASTSTTSARTPKPLDNPVLETETEAKVESAGAEAETEAQALLPSRLQLLYSSHPALLSFITSALSHTNNSANSILNDPSYTATHGHVSADAHGHSHSAYGHSGTQQQQLSPRTVAAIARAIDSALVNAKGESTQDIIARVLNNNTAHNLSLSTVINNANVNANASTVNSAVGNASVQSTPVKQRQQQHQPSGGSGGYNATRGVGLIDHTKAADADDAVDGPGAETKPSATSTPRKPKNGSNVSMMIMDVNSGNKNNIKTPVSSSYNSSLNPAPSGLSATLCANTEALISLGILPPPSATSSAFDNGSRGLTSMFGDGVTSAAAAFDPTAALSAATLSKNDNDIRGDAGSNPSIPGVFAVSRGSVCDVPGAPQSLGTKAEVLAAARAVAAAVKREKEFGMKQRQYQAEISGAKQQHEPHSINSINNNNVNSNVGANMNAGNVVVTPRVPSRVLTSGVLSVSGGSSSNVSTPVKPPGLRRPSLSQSPSLPLPLPPVPTATLASAHSITSPGSGSRNSDDAGSGNAGAGNGDAGAGKADAAVITVTAPPVASPENYNTLHIRDHNKNNNDDGDVVKTPSGITQHGSRGVTVSSTGTLPGSGSATSPDAKMTVGATGATGTVPSPISAMPGLPLPTVPSDETSSLRSLQQQQQSPGQQQQGLQELKQQLLGLDLPADLINLLR